MKGLLIKDVCVIIKQMRMFLLMIAVFACIPGMSTTTFAVVYAGMLPISALSFDERSKWNNLAAMMPYTTRQIVLSKYLMGYALMLLAGLLAGGASTVVAFAKTGAAAPADEYALIATVMCAGVVFIALNLPLMFKIGVEKGRLAYLCFTVAMVLGAVSLGNGIAENLGQREMGIGMFGIMLLAALVINAVSILLSIHFLNKRHN